jgi:uncharacterized membrane protein YjjP (DUF1212 family)
VVGDRNAQVATDSGIAVADADALRFLQLCARLLLEYNVRSELIKRQIDSIARHLDVDVKTFVSYRDVTLVATGGRNFHAQAPELRINVAISLTVQRVIEALLTNDIGLDEATRRLEEVERAAPRHNRWLLAAIFGLAACALAWILLADWGAIAVSGVASALGLIARQELAKRHVGLFAAPLAAALIGAGLGGTAILLGWTETAGLCLVVPALMLVPGPHLINGVEDVLENHMQTGLCRLGLATCVLIASAIGVFVGAWLTIGRSDVALDPSNRMQLTLVLDVLLAGAAACGFGAFYNTPWRLLWTSVLCGMIGHGIRFVCMQHGVNQGAATFGACLVIGLLTSGFVHQLRVPFAAIAFAGAVPMMPGVFIYQSIAGAVRLSLAGPTADPATAAATLALWFKAAFVVGAMALGLLLGARTARLVGLNPAVK